MFYQEMFLKRRIDQMLALKKSSDISEAFRLGADVYQRVGLVEMRSGSGQSSFNLDLGVGKVVIGFDKD